VKRAAGRSIQPWIYAGSIAAHLAFFAVIARLPMPKRSDVVAIDFAELKKKTELPKPPPTPPTPPREAKPKPPPSRAVAQAQPKPAEEPAKEPPRRPEVGADGFADLGAVPLRDEGRAGPDAGTAPLAPSGPAVAAPKPTSHRMKQLFAAAQEVCDEPVVKPKVKTPGQITYTKEGQEAEIEGSVRVQLTVDETGKVISASVLTGLGYGLDERALAAARDTLFEPATLCGSPVVATKVLAFTFELR
jgi:periplasmic protein TonB